MGLMAAAGLAASAVFPVQAATRLEFTVPSAATSEATRAFYLLIREFQQANPDIEVALTPISDWDEVAARALAARREGRSGGLFVAEVSTTVELVAADAVQALDKAMGPAEFDKFKARLIPSFTGNSSVKGVFYCPPFMRSLPVAFYNMDKLTAAGVAHLPATWDELEAALAKVKAHSGQAPFAFGGDWYDYLFEATVLSAGGRLWSPETGKVSLDGPEAVEALRFWKRLKDKGLMVRTQLWKATINGFADGAYAVTYYSSGGMSQAAEKARFHWMADGLPKAKVNAVAQGGGNLCLSSGLAPEQRAAALRFVNFLYSPGAQATISKWSGFFPVVDAAFDEPVLAERFAKEEPFRRVRAQLPTAQSKLMAMDGLKVRGILKAAIDRSLDEGMEPAASLARAQKEVEAALKP
jgi:sn-glycerol 3-phosphate transport system substrate-binding protein